MRKSIIVLFILTAVVLLLPSCKDEAGTTSLKLILKSDSATRLISSQSVDISYYKIIGTGPDNGEETPQAVEEIVNVPNTSVTLQGLIIGSWTFTVTAYNAEDTPLMEGSVNLYVSSRPSPVTINVNDPVGVGSISLNISWNAPEVTKPSLKVYLRGPSMENAEHDDSENVQMLTSSTAAYTVSNLVSGNYVVRTELYDDTSYYGGKVETVKVFKDDTTTGTEVITYDSNITLKNTGLTLQTIYGRPVQGTISCTSRNDHILYSAEDAVLNFSVKSTITVNDSDYTVEWYYDGVKQTQGTTGLSGNISTFTFNPEVGVHIVDVVCYNKSYASVGSAEWSFTAVARGEVGSLFIQREVQNGENGVDIDNVPLIGALPGERFIVLSNSSHLLQVCRLANDGIKVDTTLDKTWFSFAEHVFSDQSANFFTVVDNLNSSSSPQENLTVFKFDASSSEPSVSVMRDINQDEMRFSAHNRDSSYPYNDIETNSFLFTDENNGTIFIGDSKSGFAGLSFHMFENGENSRNLAMYILDSDGYTSKSGSIANSRYFYTLPEKAAVSYMTWDSSEKVFSGDMPDEIPIRFKASYIKAVSDVEFIVSDGTSQTCVYLWQSSGWTVTAAVNHPITKACLDEESDYVYMLDKTNSLIYSYSLSSAGALNQLNILTCENLDDIAISGDSLLASTNDGKLLFCKVVTE